MIKYGYPIGHARTAKKQGDWMNENNIKTNLAGLLEYTYNPTEVNLDIPHKNLTFKGYRRKTVMWECATRYGLSPRWAV